VLAGLAASAATGAAGAFFLFGRSVAFAVAVRANTAKVEIISFFILVFLYDCGYIIDNEVCLIFYQPILLLVEGNV
jgi:hypothetical protein